MGCKIPRRGEKHPLKNKLQQGQMLRLGGPEDNGAGCKTSPGARSARPRHHRPPSPHGVSTGVSLERDVHGNTAGHALRELTEIKFIPSTRRGRPAWQSRGCGEETGRCIIHCSRAGLSTNPKEPHSQPWDCRIHPRHLSGACWDELGAGAWVWQAALAEAQGSDPSGAGRSGEHRERIYLPQESAWRGCRNRNHLHAWKRNLLPHDKATGSQWC